MNVKVSNFCDKYLTCSENKTKTDIEFATNQKLEKGKCADAKTPTQKEIFLAKAITLIFETNCFCAVTECAEKTTQATKIQNVEEPVASIFQKNLE